MPICWRRKRRASEEGIINYANLPEKEEESNRAKDSEEYHTPSVSFCKHLKCSNVENKEELK
jgi:hypothetical protein